MRVFRGAKSVILRLGVTVCISSVLINQSKKKSGSAETFLVYAPLVPLSLWHHHVSSCFSVSITLSSLTNSHTYSPLIVITHLTSSVFVLLLPSVFVFSLYCLCFIECRCDYGLLCLSDRCQGHSIADISTLSLPHKHHAHIHTRTLTSSPLLRDVLLIGLSLVTVWEDDLSRRFLCRVVTGTSML